MNILFNLVKSLKLNNVQCAELITLANFDPELCAEFL